MQRRNWIMLAVAVVIGLFAVLIANSWFSGVENRGEQPTGQQSNTAIVVATQPMEFGARLTPQNVRLQAWPAASVPQGAFMTVDEALKNDRVALRPIVPGEPVLASKVSGADGRATLAALLPAGMRAVSIPITAARGVSGFVLPGTMVDVILTRQIAGDGATAEDLRSDVILENVQVLAIDQLADEKQGEPKLAKTATLAVTLFDAQRLAIAEKVGTLSLVLRKVEDAAAGIPGGRTVTSRQLGGPAMVIPQRRNAPQAVAAGGASIVAPGLPGLAAAPAGAVFNGPSMTVIRGTQATAYPVGQTKGR